MPNEKMITKFFRAEVKQIDEENHRVLVVMSDETVDRSDEIIDVTGWEKHLGTFRAHPILLSSHTYGDLRKQIGETEKIFVEDGKLMAWHKYYVGEGNDEADWGWNLARKNIAAYSVGFIPFKTMFFGDLAEDEMGKARQRYKLRPDQKVRRIYLEQELLENSQVVVPCNPSALQESVKDVDMMVCKAVDDLALTTKLWEDDPDWTEIRYRVRNPDLFVRIRRAKMPGVNIYMLVGPLKSDPEGGAKIQSLRFPKPEWTLEKAKKWVAEHPDIGKNLNGIVALELNDDIEWQDCDAEGNVKDTPILDIIVEERQKTEKIWVCPHCKKDIGEKELGGEMQGDQLVRYYHRPCGGKIRLPKSNQDSDSIISKVFEPTDSKGAIPFHDYGYETSEGANWDAAREIVGTDVAVLKRICAWFDSDNADNATAYKLPHHRKGGGNKAVWGGVRAAMAVLLGARGGVDIPEADRKKVFGHLSKHYAHWSKTPPEFKEYTDIELIRMFPETDIEKMLVAIYDCSKEMFGALMTVKEFETDIKEVLLQVKEYLDEEPVEPVVDPGKEPDGKTPDGKTLYSVILDRGRDTLTKIEKAGKK